MSSTFNRPATLNDTTNNKKVLNEQLEQDLRSRWMNFMEIREERNHLYVSIIVKLGRQLLSQNMIIDQLVIT